ncbi:MAG: divergent PAP2 family protein [Patescibacteria group bacterium]|nr:divergent PAP2 family protein [Patescibacteria group bacterium]MDD4304581.1 divergent PAP2 family protein [Patescibacteria group bacterium]MDD4695616.1 divergent PAP2 family protein [Patescibacteria group bacterium]
MKYEFLIIPIVIVILTQFVFKSIVLIFKNKFTWKNILCYGGMPSAHSALVSSIATIMAIRSGIDSPEFAMSFFLAAIVIADAVGLRGFITDQSKTINKIIIDLPDNKEYKYDILNERIAHTLSETLIGIIIGVSLTLLIIFI